MNNRKKKFKKQRSISYTYTTRVPNEVLKVSRSISEENLNTDDDEYQELEHQVAGHQFIKGKDSIGIIKCKNGTILKPITKPEIGQREVNFYKELQTTKDPSLLELKEYTSHFFGTKHMDINGRKVEFIILQNLLEDIAEPCIIDVKIGRQTWDPAASEEKIEREKMKYANCKNDVSFCIPGFQVYKPATGRLCKYNKEYGKKLNGQTVIEALRIFLNGDIYGNVNRELLMQLLTMLWKIQKWAKSQKSVKLYSTSLLIIYDFKVLKTLIDIQSPTSPTRKFVHSALQRKSSFKSPESYSGGSNSCFSGQITKSGPILTSPTMSKSLSFTLNEPKMQNMNNTQLSWYQSFHKMRKSHSFNYNDYLTKINQDYTSTLRELNGEEKNDKKQWCDVKIIDFAHAYHSTDQKTDVNYIEGIDNIVNIFENFLNREYSQNVLQISPR